VSDWVAHVVEATVQRDDAAAYATVRTRWTRRVLADLGARLELAALSQAAEAARGNRSRQP
jgi:hypothetical protein